MMSFSLSGGVEVFGFISPSEPTDQYPVIDPLYGIDGFRNVDLLSDLNNIPDLRRRAGMVVGVSGGTDYYKLNPSPWNGTLSDWSIFNTGGGGGTFTGGTVSGSTIFLNGLTANTIYSPIISGGTLYGDGSNLTGIPNTFTTGATYSNGFAYFDRNDILSAYTLDLTSLTGDANTFITAYTYSNNVLTISNNNNNTNFSVTINDFSGLTINGNLNVTGNTTTNNLTANTISASTYLNLPIDVFVTGGTYSNGSATFTNNTGGTFNVTGFYTGETSYVNSLTTGTGLSANTTTGNINIINTDPDQVVTISGGTGILTGGTYPNFTITNTDPDQIVTLNDGQYISVTGTYPNFTISTTGITDNDKFTTGFTYNDNTFTLTDNSGNTLTATINDVTGLTVNGDFSVTGQTLTNVLTANTLNISTTPTTNNNETSVLVRNSTTGDVELSSINSLLITNNTITVALTGSTGVDFNSIKDAINSITGATSANTYTVRVAGGVYNEDPFTIPSYAAIKGDTSISTVIQANDPSQTLIHLSDQSGIFDFQIQGCTGTGVSAIVYSSSTTPQSAAISYVENVRFGANYTHAKVVAYGGANIIMQCSNVKYGGYPFTIGFYSTNSGSGIGRMQLRNVTSTNGGIVTTSGLVFAKADAPSCGFIVNGCLLTKAAGAAAGTGFYVENGGFLRLTAVNFQRWAIGIDAPQIGSAPSIDAIALNFENNTIDVNIAHSGATGKVQGTDNFLKTIINQNAPLYEVNQDPKEITVAKKGGDFSSIKSAVDYLISSGNTSINNRYVISVDPGEFYENEIDLTQTPYVSIVGSNIQTTQILPNTNTQHIIKIGINNEISFLSLSGAPSGYAGIYCYDVGDFAQAHKISMYDCDTNIWIESDTQDTKFYGEYIDYNGEYTYGTKVIGNNGYLALANMENYFNFPTGGNITYCNYATGSGATLSIFVGDNQSNGVSGSTAYYVQDGAGLYCSTITVDGFTYGIRNPNVGLPIRFDVDNASFVSGEWDLYVERIGTFGTFGGSSNHEKVFTVSDDVYWAFLDIEDGEFGITRKASVTFTDGSHTDFTTLIFEGSTMGLLSGGSISVISGFTVQADSGFGYLEKSDNSGIVRRIDWVNNLITLSANTDNYIYINENSNLVSSGTKPITSYNILLGRVVTNSTGVEFIDLSPLNAEHTSNRFDSLFTEALGPIFANGSIVTEGTTPFTLDVTQGDYHFSSNEFLPTGGTGLTFTQYYRNGTGSTWVTTATTLVNNTQYDFNGTLTGLTTGYFTKHTLYTVGEGSYENYFLVLGQNEYSTLVQTENALLPTPPTYFTDGVVQIANIYVQEGTSGITQIEDIRPTIAFRAGGVNASSVHGNLLGLTADDHTQYLLVSGARAMSGNLDMGTNNIVSAGTINGVTIQSHATRHQFGGLDPVGSTTPSANAIPYADVSGTLNDWISTASTTTFGKVKTSSSSTTVVSDNDNRFLNSFTGGTYSGGTLSLSTVSGGSYNITGFSAGNTDVFVTGSTYSNNTFTFTNNTGGTFNVLFNTVTGLTDNGDLTVTGNTVLGGRLVNLGGTTVTDPQYRTSLGGSNISPRATFGVESVGATNQRYIFDPVNQNGLVFAVANNGSTYIARAAIKVGNTNNTISQESGDLQFFTLTGSSFSEKMIITAVGNVGINTSTPSVRLEVNGKTKTTNFQMTSGATNGYVLTSDSLGNSYWGLQSSFTGGTVTGSTIFTNGLSATTISATTYQNLPVDVFVTGGTYSSGSATFTNNTGGTFSVTGLTEPFSGGSGNCITDLYVTNVYGCSPITIHDSIQSPTSYVSGITSFAFGNAVSATTNYSFAQGDYTTSSGSYSHAEGGATTSSGNYSHAEGNGTTSSGYGSHSEGIATLSSGNYSHAEGESTISSGRSSHSEGYQTTSTGNYSHSEGQQTTSSGIYSHSEGKQTNSSGGWSHSEGNQTISSGIYSHSEGQQTISIGDWSHSEGSETISRGNWSHSEGSETISAGKNSHSEGDSTISGAFGYLVKFLSGFTQFDPSIGDITSYFGNYVVLDDYISNSIYGYYEVSGVTFNGSETDLQLMDTSFNSTVILSFPNVRTPFKSDINTGHFSHSEGLSGITHGLWSHSEGNDTRSIGLWSHAEGKETISWGNGSHSEGISTNAFGDYSHSEGIGTVTSGDYQHAQGLWNTTGDTTQGAFIVGNGTNNSNRSNLIFAAGNQVNISGKTITTNFQMTSGGTNGYVLTSDANGNASWQPSSGGSTFTGGTVTGPTVFTNGLTANTVSATTYQNLPIDVFVTGGTYSSGIATFTNNTGGTFTVTGFTTGGTSGTDVFVTGSTYSNNTFTFTNNTGGTFNVLFNTVTGLTSTGTISSSVLSATTYQNLPTDIRVTGGTYSNGTATFTNNTGGTFNVTGFVSADTFVTGVTYSANTLTISRNQGQSNLTATIGLNIKSGTVTAASFIGTPRKYTVTFTNTYPTTNYTIGITGSDNRVFTYESKTTTGFIINTNANAALTGNVDWQTIATGES